MSSSNEKIDKHVLRKFEIGQIIGKGAYGIVWKAMDKKTHRTVALKKIFDAFQNMTDAQRTFREIMLLFSIKHENIIRLLDVIKAANDVDIYLVFESMETDLHAVIHANILEDIHKKYIIYQLLKVLKYMHSADLIHRDIKPSNLLLNSECFMKLADFGLARAVDSKNNFKQDVILTDYVATRWYRAPEILLGSTKYSKAVDMWAVGCILAELIAGKPVFPGGSTMNQLQRIIDISGRPTKEDIRCVNSVYAESMINSIPDNQQTKGSSSTYVDNNALMEKNLASAFPTADREALDLLKQLIQFNPLKRITAEEALKHPYVKVFHKEKEEPNCSKKINLFLNDNKRYSIEEYRQKLYNYVRRRRKGKNRSKYRSSRRKEDGNGEKTEKKRSIGTSGTKAVSSSSRNKPKSTSSTTKKRVARRKIKKGVS